MKRSPFKIGFGAHPLKRHMRLGAIVRWMLIPVTLTLASAALADRITLSDVSSDDTDPAVLDATLDFIVTEDTLLLSVTNTTTSPNEFDLTEISFNGSESVTGLTLVGANSSIEGDVSAGWLLLADQSADGFGTHDFQLERASSSDDVSPGETVTFEFAIGGTGPFTASDFTEELSTAPPGIQVFAAVHFQSGPLGDSAHGANTSGPDDPVCGNGVLEGTEECDSADDSCCACRNVQVFGTAGDDIIDVVDLGFPDGAVVAGLGGSDTILGSAGDDVMCGGPGNDTLLGYGGNDTLRGGADSDDLLGHEGNDDLAGGDGNDSLQGGVGDDLLDGGLGDDDVVGNDGDDDMSGGPGNDALRADDGNDIMRGGPGKDDLVGGLGNDTGFGDDDNDTLSGGFGDDFLVGGDGKDTVQGQEDNDILDGGAGNGDAILGGFGDDHLDGGAGSKDFCDGDEGVDTATAECELTRDIP